MSGSARRIRASATSPGGTFTANSQGQFATDSSPAATLGPTAVEVATTSALNPTPRPSRLDG